jgi:hypothetical protein
MRVEPASAPELSFLPAAFVTRGPTPADPPIEEYLKDTCWNRSGKGQKRLIPQ